MIAPNFWVTPYPFPFPQIKALRNEPEALASLLPLVRRGLVNFNLASPWTVEELYRHLLPSLIFFRNDEAAVLLHGCLQAHRKSGEPLPVCPAHCPEIGVPRCSGFRTAPQCPVALTHAASLPDGGTRIQVHPADHSIDAQESVFP